MEAGQVVWSKGNTVVVCNQTAEHIGYHLRQVVHFYEIKVFWNFDGRRLVCMRWNGGTFLLCLMRFTLMIFLWRSRRLWSRTGHRSDLAVVHSRSQEVETVVKHIHSWQCPVNTR